MENSKYNTFIEGYNKGIGEFLNKVSGSFFDRIRYDKEIIIKNSDSELLTGKMNQIEELIQKPDAGNYDKLKVTGVILMDIAADLISNQNPLVKKSAANILNSFFDVAKQTEDEELLRTAVEIRKRVA